MTPRLLLRVFVSPAVLCATGFAAALGAVLQYSLRAYVPGSLEPGGFTLANFTALLHPLYARVFLDTVWICCLTAFFTLILGYPLAFALVHARSVVLKSAILVITVTPLFLGEVVRTYSWIVVLGNNGFLNSMLLKAGLIDAPLQLMFTRLGVVTALVHVTLPVVVIMLAAALAHIDRDYQRAAASLGAGPIRAFLTVTLPLSTPGIIASVTTAFAWTFSAFAIALDRYEFRLKRTLEAVLLSPLVVPHFTIGLGFLILFAQLGLARGYAVIIACHIVLVLPFVLRSVYISLRNLDPRLELAAASLGAPPHRVLATITLPLLAPGLVSGWLFAAILSFNEFTASLFVTAQRTQTLPVALYNYVREYADPSMAAISVMYIVATAMLLIFANAFLGLARVLNVEHPR